MAQRIRRWIRSVAIVSVIVGLAPAVGQAADSAANRVSPTLLEQALAGPLRGVDEVVFCTRSRYDDGHWYANIGYYCDDANRKAYAGNGRPDDGKLCTFNLRTGTVAILLDAQGGSVRDPQLHYDGRKILFSYRKAGSDCYHLYEINTDGSGLKELTDCDCHQVIDHDSHHVRKPLAAVSRIPGNPYPPILPELPEHLFELRRAGDFSFFELHSPFLADFLERVDHLLGQSDGFRDHHVQHLFLQALITSKRAERSIMELVLQDEEDVVPVYFEVISHANSFLSDC